MRVGQVGVGPRFGRVAGGDAAVAGAPGVVLAGSVHDLDGPTGDDLAVRRSLLVDDQRDAGVVLHVGPPRGALTRRHPDAVVLEHEPDRYNARRAVGTDGGETHEVAGLFEKG